MIPAIRITVFCTLILRVLAFSQSPPTSIPVANLSALPLRVHAELPQHNLFGPSLVEALNSGRTLADSRRVQWKGMDFIVPDDPGNLAGFSLEALMKLYSQLTCRADAIAVGRINAQASHVSASSTSVYSDYSVLIERFLKDNRQSSIAQRAPIVVTRPGGIVMLTNGKASFDSQEFPRLESGATYLQFLRHIPESGGYQPIDSFSTLVSTNGQWAIARRAFSGLVVPGFSPRALEASIRDWSAQCK